MKLQVHGQSLRLRLDEAELSRLLAGEAIVNATDLGQGGMFRQRLALHHEPAASLLAIDGEWHLGLPESIVRDYVGRLPCREALSVELDDRAGAPLSLHFEVDVRDSLQVRGARRRRDGGPAV